MPRSKDGSSGTRKRRTPGQRIREALADPVREVASGGQPVKPLTLERALAVLAKSDTVREAKLCPCTPCRNRLRHLIYELMGFNTRTMRTEAPDTRGIAEELQAAVELGIEDLMPAVAEKRPILKLQMSSGYPKGGK